MFSVNTRADNSLDANVPDEQQQASKQTPAFVTEQSVTSFAAMTGVATTIWQALQKADKDRFGSVWWALAVAALIGVALTAPILNDRDRPAGDWIRAGAFALINTFVLWAAAIGIDQEVAE